jgi:8-oxo-dGTP diphosphatase
MSREYPETPLIGVGAVIVQNRRVLLIRRGQPPLLGEWSLPGGVLECGESLRDAVIREVQEETGLTVEPRQMLGVYERIICDAGKNSEGQLGADARARVRYHYVLIDFLCHPAGGELRAGTDADDARWFRPEELAELNLPSDTLDVIRKGLSTE